MSKSLPSNLPGAELQELTHAAIQLLKTLIAIPSYSTEENETANFLMNFLLEKNIMCKRVINNVWATNKDFEINKPTLLLNSHHDTVKPNAGFTLNPFFPIEKDGKLYGLGSNDAGGCLVSLLISFIYFYDKELPFNLLFAASAEEEISGKNGIELLLKELPDIDYAIVGEPTGLKMAVAEKGLMVLDGIAKGKAGHAAREEGKNAIYAAMKDIHWFQHYSFLKVSDLLGQVHMAVTNIETPNKAHNVIPDRCNFVVDVRVNELYRFDEVLDIIQQNVTSEIIPRSLRLEASAIPGTHPLVIAGTNNGLSSYGSPTLSDMALMNFPALKIGPGESERSHSADEFIYVEEIKEGIATYISLIESFSSELKKSGKTS